MPAGGKGEHRLNARVRVAAVDDEDDEYLFGTCSVLTSAYLVLMAFITISCLFFLFVYQKSPHALIGLPIPVFVVICTVLAMCLQNHKLMYPIIIAKFTIFLVLFVCLIGYIFLALTMSYNILRYSLFEVIDDKDMLCKAARLVVLVNGLFWLFVFIVAVTWELGVLVVCKEFYKSKHSATSAAVVTRIEKHKSPADSKGSPSSLTAFPL